MSSGTISPADEPAAFRIRDAQPPDLSALTQLHVETFEETHGRLGAPSYELRERQWQVAFESVAGWL